MAKLTGKQRRKLPKSKFGLPGRRAYPLDTKARARNESKATQKTIRARATKLWPSLKKNKRKG